MTCGFRVANSSVAGQVGCVLVSACLLLVSLCAAATNVVLMIGDGMGDAQIAAAR